MKHMTALRGDHRSSAVPSYIALIGTCPPRLCGIATFTADCRDALKHCHPDMKIDGYALDDGSGDIAYPKDTHLIAQEDRTAYAVAAQAIESSGADVIWLQHEFGIFGGPAGSHILHLLERTSLPLIVTLHTILEQPGVEQERVMRALVARAAHVIVMAEFGREILIRKYGMSRDRISVIPHGVPDRPLVEADDFKPRFGLEGRKVILTFGLLALDKGIDTMIGALPAIVAQHPDALYVILGATHPHLVRREGEALRERLQEQAAALKVSGNVMFIDRYVELPELLDRLQAADIYVTPYNNPAQVTSGTLSYAVGMGKPVVSTPYVHAREILSGDCGILTPFGDSKAMADAIVALLDNAELRSCYSTRAYARGRTMLWAQYAACAAQLLGEVRSTVPGKPKMTLVPTVLAPDVAAVIRMSDSTGIFQHGFFSIPDRRHGYCLDDNARALMLMAQMHDLEPAVRQHWTSVYGGFVEYAWNEDASRFRNFMRFDRQWCETAGSDDSFGRAVWALGITARDHPEAQYRDWAAHLLDRCLPAVPTLRSPRACALVMLGVAAFAEARESSAQARRILETFGDELVALFAASRRPDWAWFEVVLAYDNARLPESLIRAGMVLGRNDFISTGLETLNWIADRQTADEGQFRAVGTESFGRVYADPLPYDQQPLEAQAMIDACCAAYASSGDEIWRVQARAAYDWYFGANDLGIPLVTEQDGGCFDGLMPGGVNRNQGAESILAMQLSSCAMARLERSKSNVAERNLQARRIVSV